MRVEVVYALPERQSLVALEVEVGCSVLAAARRSGLAELYPELQWDTAVLGIFGKRIEQPGETVLQEGDRVEIYRPLQIDPKAVRKQRAGKNKNSP